MMERPVSLSELLDDFEDSLLSDIHTAIPGEIDSYEGEDTRKAKIKILVKLAMPDGEILSAGVISDVPVQFPGSSSFSLTYPLKKGDKGLLIFSEHGIGNYLTGDGSEQDPDNISKFALTDAIFIPGIWPFSQVNKTTDNSIKVDEAGNIEINSKTQVNINGNLTIDV